MTSVEFVEKALIGSLLHDSTLRDDLPWLNAEDFTNPLCRAMWRHLDSGNPPYCKPVVDFVEMSEVLGRDYELHASLRGPAELATLQVQAPAKPSVAEYGRILVEATTRRQVVAMGVRLESLARSERGQIIDGVADALASLEVLDQRWEVSNQQHAPVDPDLGAAAPPVRADELSPPAKPNIETFTAAHDMDHEMAEKAVIGAAVHDWPPGARARVLNSVRAIDFTDERAAATWQAVEHLAGCNTPIDEITVAWQCARARAKTGDGLTVEELRETRNAAVLHEMGAAHLVRSTLTSVADQAQIEISRCAQDLRVDSAALIDTAATHHVTVAALARRLTGDYIARAPVPAVKKRMLLTQTRRSPITTATASAIDQHPYTHLVDLR